MKHLHRLRDEVLGWATCEPLVEAVLWHGSVVRGDATPASDLDVVIVHGASTPATAVVASLSKHFGERLRFASHSKTDASLWVDASLTKIDLHMGSDAECFAWLADSPDAPAPRLCIGLDKTGCCGALVTRASRVFARDRVSLCNDEIDKFITGFEAASAAHRRSDGYQFYFHYNLALHRLARLIELLRGDAAYLFLPKLLLSRRMPLPEQQKWRGLRGTMYLPEANEAKRQLAESFIATLKDIATVVPITRSPDAIAQFLNSIIQRDLFFNVRDFADSYDGKVKSGMLFRASSLTRWQDEPLLSRWLADTGIRTIIDLRHPAEMTDAKAQYRSDLLSSIRYVNCPLSGPPLPDRTPAPAEFGRVYYSLLQEHLFAVVEALRTLAMPDAGPTVVHCHVGKDRTGLFCALVALLLDMPRESIHADYMLSGQGVAEKAIRDFVESVESAGGAESVLAAAGLDHATVVVLRRQLLN